CDIRGFAMIRHSLGRFRSGSGSPPIEAKEMAEAVDICFASFGRRPMQRVQVPVQESEFTEGTTVQIHDQPRALILEHDRWPVWRRFPCPALGNGLSQGQSEQHKSRRRRSIGDPAWAHVTWSVLWPAAESYRRFCWP